MGGNVTSAGWQVTLCNPMWHVSSHSGVATLRTAIHLLLLLTYSLITRLRLRMADPCTKFEVSSVSHCEDITWDVKF